MFWESEDSESDDSTDGGKFSPLPPYTSRLSLSLYVYSRPLYTEPDESRTAITKLGISLGTYRPIAARALQGPFSSDPGPKPVSNSKLATGSLSLSLAPNRKEFQPTFLPANSQVTFLI